MATYSFAKTGNGNISIKVTGATVNYPEKTITPSRLKEIRLSKNGSNAIVVELLDGTDYTISPSSDAVVLAPDPLTPAGTTYAAGSKTNAQLKALMDDSMVFRKANTGSSQSTGTTLMLNAVSSTQINATWTAVSNATNYALERSTTADFASPTTVYSGTALTFSNTGLTAGTQYYYRVKVTIVVTSTAKTVTTNSAVVSNNTFPFTFPFNLS